MDFDANKLYNYINQKYNLKMEKPKFDLSFRLNLGGYIWRRELRESATGEKYWHYYISNAKEPECDSQEN